jgi:Domain of unknown function (DUF4871)
MKSVLLLIKFLVLIILVGCTEIEETKSINEDKNENIGVLDSPTQHKTEPPVKIDEQLLSKTSWETSSTFESSGFKMLGKPQKVGIIYEPFESGKTKKYMWHFWGNNIPSGKLTVLGLKEGTKTVKPVLELDGYLVWASRELGGANNGADAHIPSNLKVNGPGKWKLFIFIGETYIDYIVIDVRRKT